MNTKKTLLLGPAGSGKTHYLLQEFTQSLNDRKNSLEDNLFFVVPSLEHTGRVVAMILQQGIEGFFYRRVTTLARLTSQMFGVGDDDVATNVTRYLLLRNLLEKKHWEYFGDTVHAKGFVSAALSFISELKESMISTDLFREKMNALKQLEPDIGGKYEALASLYEGYEAALKEKG